MQNSGVKSNDIYWEEGLKFLKPIIFTFIYIFKTIFLVLKRHLWMDIAS